MKNLYSYYIRESLEKVYHYMSVEDLISLLKTDEFYLEENDGCNPSNLKNYNYLSTTRQRNALTGYPTGIINPNIVRLTLDYDKLHSKYKSAPVDWSRAKRKALRSNWDDENFETMKNSLMLQTDVEMEERFFIKQDSIPNFFKYVIQIDLCEEHCHKNQLDEVVRLLEKYPNVAFNIYKKEKDFKLGT